MAKSHTNKIEGKLTYPNDLNKDHNDFIQFGHFPYRVNDAIDGSVSHDTLFRGHYVHLYMPNSTPGTPNDQGWNSQTFPGERGQLSKQILAFAGKSGESFRSLAGKQRMADIGEAMRQNFLDGIAQKIGADAATALQLGKGQVYNPNVEMMYKMPSLRQFRFDFDFIPKNAGETNTVDAIIREFKEWSSPSAQGNGKFLGLPDLWNVTYFEGGTNRQYRRLNKFKYCVLESVRVTENPKSTYHITIDDPNGPAPVHTSLSLLFTETDIITREEHRKAFAQGYKRYY